MIPEIKALEKASTTITNLEFIGPACTYSAPQDLTPITHFALIRIGDWLEIYAEGALRPSSVAKLKHIIESHLRYELIGLKDKRQINDLHNLYKGNEHWFDWNTEELTFKPNPNTAKEGLNSYLYHIGPGANDYAQIAGAPTGKEVSLEEGEANFKDRLSSIKRRVESEFDKAVKSILDEFFNGDYYLNTLQNAPSPKLDEPTAFVAFNLDVWKNGSTWHTRKNDAVRNLFDTLKRINLLSEGMKIKSFEALFGIGEWKNEKMEWIGMKKYLGLFAGHLPRAIAPTSTQQIIASAFTCDNKEVTRIQLSNGGRPTNFKKGDKVATIIKKAVRQFKDALNHM